MKTQSTNLFSQISKAQVKDLTAAVKETFDVGDTDKQSKIFSAAELWNIQHRYKILNPRRGFAF